MMKNLLFLSAAALCLLGSSCSKEGPVDPQPAGETIRLYVSDEASQVSVDSSESSSRAAFDEAKHIVWQTGDQIKVNGETYTVEYDVADNSWFVSVPTAEKYTAYYPAERWYSIENADYMWLHHNQSYVAGSFDPLAYCACAEAAPGGKLVFKSLCSMIKLTLKGDAEISSIELYAMETVSPPKYADYWVSGVAAISKDAGGNYCLDMSNPVSLKSYYTTLSSTEPVQLTAEGVDFYMTLVSGDGPAGGYGFVINGTFPSGQTLRNVKFTKPQSILRGQILKMPALTIAEDTSSPVLYSTDGTTWTPWKYATDGVTPAALSYPASGKLYFKNNEWAEKKGLTRAHLQSLADSFRSYDLNATQFIEYDWSQTTYESTIFPSDIFCGVYWNGGVDAAKMDRTLKAVALPRNITQIADCILTSPPGLESLLEDNMGAFMACAILERVQLPVGLTRIGSGAFAFCRNVKTITIPASGKLLTIGKRAFSYMDILAEFRCELTTPPTLEMAGTTNQTPFYNSQASTGIVFRVPVASLSKYQSDANWQQVISEKTNRSWATF